MKNVLNFLRNLNTKLKGLLLCLFVSLIILFCFFGTILSSPNKYYFDKSGDGLLTYYYATYQLKYDSAYWHLSASNYPHGESVFFSSDQSVLTAGLRFVNNNLFKVEDNIAGIFNILMLFSFILCSIFIYLILYEFKTPYIFAALSAAGIAFLSPQWIRIEAHFPLSYSFALPVFFYLLIQFDKNQKYKTCIAMGIFVFIMACLHIYFIGFFGAVLVVYYLINFFIRPDKIQTLKKSGIALFLQLLIPYIILQFCINQTSSVTDRTANPWGFLWYISDLDGLFFPFGKPYQSMVRKYYTPGEILQFEGQSYVGLLAILTSIVFLLVKVFQLLTLRFKKFIFISEYKILIIFLVAGILSALYACGIPYIYNEKWVSYIGPLRQMRGLGRFAWVLFYVLNIFCIYYLTLLIEKIKFKSLRVALYTIPLAILFYDAYYNVKPISEAVANKISVLEDKNNELPDNKWVNEIDSKRYQAIIPLPYFLLGSENIGVEPESHGIVALTYIASLKTGLPITAAVLSRTSLSQTYDNISMLLEPYRPLNIVKYFPNKKPFLLIVHDFFLNDLQKNFLSKAVYIKETPKFNLYEVSYNVLANYADSLYNITTRQFSGTPTFPVDGWLCSKNSKNFAYKSFDDRWSTESYRGKGAYESKIKDYSRIFEDTIPGAVTGQNFKMSFWMKDFTKDLYPRTTLEVTYLDSATGAAYNSYWTNPAVHLKTLDGSWALIELSLKPVHAHDKITVTLWNSQVYDDSKLIIDEFLIRQDANDLYRIFPNEIEKNNRFYRK